MHNYTQYGRASTDGTNASRDTTASMSPDEVRAHNAKLHADHLAEQARAQKAEAELRQRQLDERIAKAVARVPDQLARREGMRSTVTGGEMRTEQLRPTIGGTTALGYMDPDVQKLPVRIGGVELSPGQAKAYLADGTISPQQYSEALTAAMQPYQPGYRHSFR